MFKNIAPSIWSISSLKSIQQRNCTLSEYTSVIEFQPKLIPSKFTTFMDLLTEIVASFLKSRIGNLFTASTLELYYLFPRLGSLWQTWGGTDGNTMDVLDFLIWVSHMDTHDYLSPNFHCLPFLGIFFLDWGAVRKYRMCQLLYSDARIYTRPT